MPLNPSEWAFLHNFYKTFFYNFYKNFTIFLAKVQSANANNGTTPINYALLMGIRGLQTMSLRRQKILPTRGGCPSRFGGPPSPYNGRFAQGEVFPMSPPTTQILAGHIVFRQPNEKHTQI